MTKTIERFREKFFGPANDIKVQVFNLLALIGMVSGVAVSVLAFAINENTFIIAFNLLISVFSFMMLSLAERKRCYRLCGWLLVSVAFLIFFPILYFSCGGYKGGAAYPFIIALVFTSLLLDGYERVLALAVELMAYVCCIVYDFHMPSLAVVLPTDSDYLFVNFLNFTVTGAIILAVLMVRTRLFENRQTLTEELNRELSARNETLAQYDTMKSDFLATVAHEVNTPLAIIAASSSEAMDLLKDDPIKVDEINDDLELIRRRVRLIDGILLDLMDTVAIEKGRIPLNRQPVNLSSHLREICDSHFRMAETNGNSVRYELNPLLPDIWVDLQRIDQVMANLLSNAIRYSENGTITVGIRRGAGRQTVCVTDEGEGMDPEMARAALKQYVSTKKNHWRHGMGLYLCRKIVTAHGGDIWIESEKGKGTSVHFSLKEGADYGGR